MATNKTPVKTKPSKPPKPSSKPATKSKAAGGMRNEMKAGTVRTGTVQTGTAKCCAANAKAKMPAGKC